MKKSAKQLKLERFEIKSKVVDEVTLLCEHWNSRSLTATSSAEAMDMLYLWFAYAWGGRLFSHNQLSADELSELVANKIIERGSLNQDDRYKQCEKITFVWRSWAYLAKKYLTVGDGRMYWFCKTQTLHPSVPISVRT